MRWTVLLLILVGVSAVASAQTADTPAGDGSPKFGQFEVHFTDQSPLSALEAQNKRYRIKLDPMHRYTLADESFEAYVPENYDPSKPYGLLVWINASKSGAPSKGWIPILEKNHLIWIGANGSGNERGIGARIGLALDAEENFRKQYNIDELRVYASGVSGGGKIASMLAMIYPEVFSGALTMAGVTYFRAVPVSASPGRAWEWEFEKPAPLYYDRAKQQSRFVLLTGTKDFARDSISDIYNQGFMADGFKHVQYVEIPEMGHGIPGAEWVEGGIATLDKPLPEVAKDLYARAQQMEKGAKKADALKLYQTAAGHLEEPLLGKAKARIAELENPAETAKPATRPAIPEIAAPKPQLSKTESDEAEAQKLLSLAESYERNNLPAQAKQRLDKIISDYPKTKSAVAAKADLARIKSRVP